jgi:hypothetical protein
MSGPNGSDAVIAAEQALLGGLLLDPRDWSKVADLVRADDFARSDHRLIFEAIATLAREGRAVDHVTVAELLERDHQLDAAGGLAYLSAVSRDTPTAQNVTSYARVVRDRAVHRRLTEALSDASGSGELTEHLERELVRLKSGTPAAPVDPLPMEPVSQWSARPAPAPRDWVIEGLVPARRLTSFLADGGLGKTTIAVQVGVHVAAGRALYGLKVNGGPVLGIFCEDEPEELQRRVTAACAAERLDLADIDRLVIISRDGEDNLLCTFESDRMVLTPFYRQLDATVAQYQPRLLILDTLADFYAGKYLETSHVRQFTKTALGGLARRHGCAVLLIAHPSTAGMNSGQGDGFSTAWNNSVRSRLYLRRPKSEDLNSATDRRVLELKKANYGPSGVSVALIWHAGAFIPDPNPIEEGSARAAKVDSLLAVAAHQYFLAKAPGGIVVTFGAAFDALHASGALADGKPDTRRKALSRALAELVKAGTLVQSKVPRGYRLADPARDIRDTPGDKLGTPGLSGHGDTRDAPSGQGRPRPERSPIDVPRAERPGRAP